MSIAEKSRARHALGVAAVAIAVLLCLPSLASADYEQVPEHFGVSGEGAQLNEALGEAVSGSGVGGVAPGSFYVVGYNGRVVRFAPGKEGEEPKFEEAWGWGIAEGGPSEAYVRCGPAYKGTASEAEQTYEHCKPAVAGRGTQGGEEPGHFSVGLGVAVDRANGYVYVRNYPEHKKHLIEVFTATGAPVGTGFGEAASGRKGGEPTESIAASPAKLHEVQIRQGSIAVDESGTVYLNDYDYELAHPRQARLMCFRPASPGDFQHYVYCGQEHDIYSTLGQRAGRIALVGSDRLAVGGAEGEEISEYEIGTGARLCSQQVSGQLQGMTANPLTGEIFYSTFSGRSIHRLGPCNEQTREFGNELQEPIKPKPETKREFLALAVNPVLAWSSERPAGVLYAVDVQNGIGDILAPAKIFPPVIAGESTLGVTTTSATLKAQIDPRGSATSYNFQYLPQATYAAQKSTAEGEGKTGAALEDAAFDGAADAPPSPGEIPSGKATTATAAISGLSPDTAYVFRAVATSHCNPAHPEEACPAEGALARFATYPIAPTGLPDGRAYELVSPAEKLGGEVFPAAPGRGSCEVNCKPPGPGNTSVFPMQSAPGGDSVVYEGYPFSLTEGAAVYNSYLSRRTESGWETTTMSPALLGTIGGLHLAYSPSLASDTILQSSPALAGAPEGYNDIYLQDASDLGTLTPLISSAPPNRGPGALALEYAGASPDFTRQFFAANDALIHEAPGVGVLPDPTAGGADPGGRDLYEWRDGSLNLLNILPGDESVAAGASFASASPDAHGISTDGRRVFFEAGGHLYVREDGQITREIAHPGTFLAASANGLEVLLSNGCLYSLATEACVELSAGAGGFLGIAGSDPDLSRIYFVDTAALAPGAEAGSCTSLGGASQEEKEGKVPPGQGCNLYLYEAGATTRFIATLVASDNKGSNQLEDWAASSAKRTAEASLDGRYLAFGSRVSLTGYDSVGPCEKVPNGKGQNSNGEFEYETIDVACREIFLYDSATGKLSCPSCNPTGESPRGPSTLPGIELAGRWQPQPRYLTNQGRLFFDSQDRLSPRDTNGKVEDVYEAEPSGLGSCERTEGCVSLISSGTGSVDSNFLAMDESGANVFFTTRERLVPSDTDELIDLYDARIGGGFPRETESQRAECQGESCQAVSQAPDDPTPSSSAFHGSGNVDEEAAKPAKCPQGKVRRGDKCVKKHKKKHDTHKKHGRAAKYGHGGGK
ncbi:MAG TPA: hypothetical protein VMH33_14000 [Solirubrobacterales bacterium]|nr:hypothetical protein [Solirubrobacterales bacterium]